MFNKTKDVKKEPVKLTKVEKALLGHILKEHIAGIENDLADSSISNRDKSSLRREAKQVQAIKEKLVN